MRYLALALALVACSGDSKSTDDTGAPTTAGDDDDGSNIDAEATRGTS